LKLKKTQTENYVQVKGVFQLFYRSTSGHFYSTKLGLLPEGGKVAVLSPVKKSFGQ
jgi:hypothetical protein